MAEPLHSNGAMGSLCSNWVYFNAEEEVLFLCLLSTLVLDIVPYLRGQVCSYLLHLTRQQVIEQMVEVHPVRAEGWILSRSI